MSNLIGYTQFVATKVGKTGLTVTCDVKSVNRSSGAAATVATGASATELIRGVYFYRLASADIQTYDYIFAFITSDGTVDQQEVPALWTRFSEAVTTDASGNVAANNLPSDYQQRAVAVTLPSAPTDWVSAASVSAAAVTKVQAGLATPTNITAGTITTCGTLTTYTGNTPQTGDAYARLGAPSTASIAADIQTRSTYAGGAVASVMAPVTAGTVTDKAGYSLAATGLNALSVAAPAGVAATFPQMVVQLWWRFFGKSTLTATQLKTYAADGTTVVTTQSVANDNTTQTQGAAS